MMTILRQFVIKLFALDTQNWLDSTCKWYVHFTLIYSSAQLYRAQQWKPMHKTTRTTYALATLALSLAPALSYAIDTAPMSSTAPVLAPVAAQAGKPAALPAAAALKADDFKETDVWGRIRTGYAIPDLDNSLVSKHVNAYAAHPDGLVRTSGRASRYLFHVVQELEKRGMPTELALLPIIESAFNPQAYSSANAAGMWQFVPGTGKDFNLKQNMFKDERRGVLASTDAALSYLQKPIWHVRRLATGLGRLQLGRR